MEQATAESWESEAKFSSAFDHAAIGMALVAPDGTWLRVNPALCRIVGYSETELLKATFQEITHPDDLVIDLGFVQQMLDREIERYQMEKRYFHKDGSIVWVLLSVSGVYDQQGTMLYFISQIQDITTSKEAVQALEESEARYRLLADTATDLVALHEPDSGRFTYLSPSARRLLGYEPEELIGASPSDLVHPEDQPANWNTWSATAERGAAATFRCRLRTRSGDYRWFETDVVPVRNDDGEVLHFRSTSRDVTEQEQATQALEQEREFLAAVLENIEDGIVACDADGVLTLFNRATREFHGLPQEPIAAERWSEYYDLFLPDGNTRMQAEDVPLYRALAGEVVRGQQLVIAPKQGRRRTLLASGRSVLNSRGQKLGAVTAMHDITTRVRAEEQLKDYNAQLERSNRELQEFAYVASHDLQEPLRMVSSYLQLLERRYRDRLDEQASEFIGYAVEGAHRMKRLISDLLEYSRVGSRGAPFAPTAAGTALQGALKNLEVSIAEAGAVVAHDPLPMVMGDDTQLLQLFQNLIGNALKFRSNARPRIHVMAVDEGSRWRFSVRDNGIGIEAEYAERVFTIFQRLHTRHAYPGTGIGLAVCRRIVERHGGRIWVESDGKTGSVFHFTLAKERGYRGIDSGGGQHRHLAGRG